MTRSSLPPYLIALGLLALGCGGNGREAISVYPPAPVVRVGEQLPLTALAQEDLAAEPEWELQEPHGGGFLQSRGMSITYVAPPSAGTYHVILRAPRLGGGSLKQTLEVRVLADPRIEPASTNVGVGESLAFSAKMRGLPRNGVTWTVEESDGGQVSPDGLYTAPRQPGTYHLTATSTFDPSVSATATVRVE